MTGLYFVVDGGYACWRCLQSGNKHAEDTLDQVYSRAVAAMRKNVEFTHVVCFSPLVQPFLNLVALQARSVVSSADLGLCYTTALSCAPELMSTTRFIRTCVFPYECDCFLHDCVRCVILHNILMWYDGRYVQPEDDEHYGKARLSARKRTLLVALETFRTNRLLAMGNNAPLPPPAGTPNPLDVDDLVDGRDADDELLISDEGTEFVEEKKAHLILRRALVTHYTVLNKK